MIYALLLVLGFGVTARVTRFLTSDYLAAPLRVKVIERFGPNSKLAYLVECPWCVSIYVAIPPAAYVVAGAAWPVPAWAMFLGTWLSFSYLYGLIASNLD